MEISSESLDAAKRAVDILGGPVRAAKVLNVKDHRYQTVQSWLRNGVPSDHCPAVERETRKAGTPVLCEELQPGVAWGVLREAKRSRRSVTDAGRS